MRFVGKRLTFANVVSMVALFVALGGGAYAISLAKNSVKSKHIKNGAVKTADLANDAVNSAKVENGSLLREDFAAGELPSGVQGPKGDPGEKGAPGAKGDPGNSGERGPSFGDGRQVPNMNDIPCGEDVVVGSQALTVTEPSRIWIHGHGSLRADGSTATDYALWLQLRDAADTTTLAVSTREWDSPSTADEIVTLSSGGLMLSGDDPDASAPPFVAPAGAYTLQLAVTAGPGACAVDFPDFGFNQGNAMGYALLGTG